MLTIKDKKIFADDGSMLKVIDCPNDVTAGDLTRASEHDFHCDKCDKKIITTDHLSEEAIVNLLTDEPNSCLKISYFDPLFRIGL